MTPFEYPAHPHIHRHGPIGYATPESFRPWLRDEFIFRCVYCLRRERWEPGHTVFEIDHLHPIAVHPELALDYINLRYCCDVCNSVKGGRLFADPCRTLLAANLKIEADGQMVGRTPDARRIIDVLGLNDDEFVQYRARWIRIVALARQHDPALYQQLLAFPDDLPNLASLRPPGGNSRPEGIEQSYFAQQQRGELAATY
jgi:hypothetical protein